MLVSGARLLSRFNVHKQKWSEEAFELNDYVPNILFVI